MPAGSSEMGRRGELGADPPRDELRAYGRTAPIPDTSTAICGTYGTFQQLGFPQRRDHAPNCHPSLTNYYYITVAGGGGGEERARQVNLNRH